MTERATDRTRDRAAEPADGSASPAAPPPSRRRARKQAKKSLWQMDLSSLGKKDDGEDLQERIERPPFEPSLPQVNLLPRQVQDSITIARIRNWTITAVAAVLVLGGALWWLQGSTIERAEADVAAATVENTRLRADLEALAPVKQMYEQITRLQEVVTTTMASQPQAAIVIQRLAEAGDVAGGDEITFSSVDVSYQGIPAPGGVLNTCPNPDPFGTEITIGCLTFSANASSRDQVSALLRAMDDDPLFIGPYVTSTTTTEVAAGPQGNRTQDVVAFSGSAGVSLEALQTLLTPEQIDALLTPPTPEPSATASSEDEDEGGSS